MKLLEQIHRGKQPMPPRLIVYGTEGIGKSTFASEAPQPIFIQTEDGLAEIECDKFPLATTFEDVQAALSELYSEQHDYQTVVIDSFDWLERLIFDALNLLRNERGMVVIGIAHSKVEKFDDPESSAYDRYSPRLHKHAVALVCESSDAVLFASRKFRTQSENAGFNRTRTIGSAIGSGGGERILRCVGGPSCIAKNRYGIAEELPLSWNAFMTALANPNHPSTGETNG